MNKNKVFNLSILLIILFAIGIRTYYFTRFYGMWMDETYLALNIDKPFSAFWGTLGWAQASPPLFMIISKIFVNIFGLKDWAFRLFPFLCSLASLCLFPLLLKDFLKTKKSILLALVLFAFNFYIIRYSVEFRTYSTDILCSILLIFIFKKIDFSKMKTIKLFFTPLIIFIFSLLSYPSLFTSFALCFVLLIFNIKTNAKKFFIFITPLAILQLIYYFSHIKTLNENQFFHNSWVYGYLNADIKNNIMIIANAFNYIFQPSFLAFFGLILFLYGAFLLFKANKKDAFILTSPILLLLILSFMQIYPFSQRMILFLAPIFIIIMAKPIDTIKIENKIKSSLVLIIMTAYFIPSLFLNFTPLTFKNESIKEVMGYISKNASEKDKIYVPITSKGQFVYYQKYFHLKNEIVFGTYKTTYKNELTKELKNLPKGNWWVISSAEFQETSLNTFINEWLHLNSKTPEKITYKNASSNSYLWHFRQQ